MIRIGKLRDRRRGVVLTVASTLNSSTGFPSRSSANA
jgi:hypothetical protein